METPHIEQGIPQLERRRDYLLELQQADYLTRERKNDIERELGHIIFELYHKYNQEYGPIAEED